MKNRVEAVVLAMLRDLNAGGEGLSALTYITTKPLLDVVTEIVTLAARHSTTQRDWQSAAARAMEQTIIGGLANDAEFHAGSAAANAGNAVWYALKGDVETSKERLLRAFENMRQAAEDHAAQIHAKSEPHIRDQAVVTARERVLRALADAAFHSLFL